LLYWRDRSLMRVPARTLTCSDLRRISIVSSLSKFTGSKMSEESFHERLIAARARTYDPSDPAQEDAWCREVVLRGAFEEGTPDIVRYWDLVDAIDGTESQLVFFALLDSMRFEDDSGQYEATYNALWNFPPEKFGPWMVAALPSRLINKKFEGHAGSILCGLINERNKADLEWFNNALAHTDEPSRVVIMAFIESNESHGWFEDGKGKIRPNAIDVHQ